MLKSDMAGSYDGPIFTLWRNFHTDFIVAGPGVCNFSDLIYIHIYVYV